MPDVFFYKFNICFPGGVHLQQVNIGPFCLDPAFPNNKVIGLNYLLIERQDKYKPTELEGWYGQFKGSIEPPRRAVGAAHSLSFGVEQT